MSVKITERTSRKRTKFPAFGIAGGFLGLAIGMYGGSTVEGILWGILTGISFFFLEKTHEDSSARQILIAITVLSSQIALFMTIGALLTWSTGDITGTPLCLKIGFLLSTLTGIVNRDLMRDMPGGVFFLIGLSMGIGAGAGALVAFLFQFSAWTGIAMGALIALLLPYYIFLINALPVFLTFVISTLGGMQVIFALGWSLLQGYYYTAMFTFGIALVLIVITYLQVHTWNKSRQNSLLPYLRL